LTLPDKRVVESFRKGLFDLKIETFLLFSHKSTQSETPFPRTSSISTPLPLVNLNQLQDFELETARIFESTPPPIKNTKHHSRCLLLLMKSSSSSSSAAFATATMAR
jgi:hypothetical protein